MMRLLPIPPRVAATDLPRNPTIDADATSGSEDGGSNSRVDAGVEFSRIIDEQFLLDGEVGLPCPLKEYQHVINYPYSSPRIIFVSPFCPCLAYHRLIVPALGERVMSLRKAIKYESG